MGKLLYTTPCLPQVDGDVSLSGSHKNTMHKLAGFFSTLSFFELTAELESVNTIFTSFGTTTQGN